MTYDPKHPAQWAVLVAEPDRFAINPRSPANGTTDAVELAGLDHRDVAEAVAREGRYPAIVNRATGERVDVVADGNSDLFTVIWRLDGDFMHTDVRLEPGLSSDEVVEKAIRVEHAEGWDEGEIDDLVKSALSHDFDRFCGYEIVSAFKAQGVVYYG